MPNSQRFKSLINEDNCKNLAIIQRDKRHYLSYCCSDTVLRETVVNRT